MDIIINPGSGPVADATLGDAKANAEHFATDLRLAGHEARVVSRPAPDGPSPDDGRFTFLLHVDGVEHEVDMPGLPLQQVRFIGTDDQNIWDFPRLYVDGSSWVWQYALGVCGDES